MPRQARGILTHTFAHVTTHGNRDAPIFPHERDRRTFLELLRECVDRAWLQVHAYCLMSTHLHLLVEVHETPLAAPMKRILQIHAQRINRRERQKGHLFADRYWARVCSKDAYLLELVRYIHLNPVLAGVVTRPEYYRWSSHHAYLDSGAGWVQTDLVLEFFGRDRTDAIREYAAFIDEGLRTKAVAGAYE